jgi:hypothetical protein
MKSLFLLFLLIWQPCYADDPDTDSWKHPEPITYESLRAWHARGGLGKYHWPKEHKADLNGDGKDEVFLGVMGFGRGMEYALFTERNGKWIALSEEVEGSHHSFESIPSKNKIWRDFRSLQPNGRGGLIETIYEWNGKQYTAKSTREITAKELHGDQEDTNAEQGGAGQPATRPESKSEGSQKPQPASEGRSR